MSSSPEHLARARAADSDRRRTHVLKVLDELAAEGQEITVSSVARAAGVHRSLIHRHGDLHAAVLGRASGPPPGTATGTQVSRKSLLADVANLTARNRRLSAHVARLERHLSEALGQTAWEASGLGARPTSRHSRAAPPSWNSSSSTCAANSPNETKTSKPPARLTVS
ncbi:hypothetical protein [Streptomyces sp. NPDC059466]|uniref:hypothetical protein n=1 Tax=unclassified Streptomyces TaxID=2593676 RepID=UPI0036BD4EB7